jgi:hypothetical protein
LALGSVYEGNMTKAARAHASTNYVFTAYPTKWTVITPGSSDFPVPGHIRAAEDCEVTFIPLANEDADTITLALVAGQIPECVVRRVTAADGVVHLLHMP